MTKCTSLHYVSVSFKNIYLYNLYVTIFNILKNFPPTHPDSLLFYNKLLLVTEVWAQIAEYY